MCWNYGFFFPSPWWVVCDVWIFCSRLLNQTFLIMSRMLSLYRFPWRRRVTAEWCLQWLCSGTYVLWPNPEDIPKVDSITGEWQTIPQGSEKNATFFQNNRTDVLTRCSSVTKMSTAPLSSLPIFFLFSLECIVCCSCMFMLMPFHLFSPGFSASCHLLFNHSLFLFVQWPLPTPILHSLRYLLWILHLSSTFFILLSSCWKCLFILLHAVSGSSTESSFYNLRKVIMTLNKQEERLQISLFFLCVSVCI